MAEHTPGPWAIWHNEKGAFVVTVDTAEGWTICNRTEIEHRSAQSIANARLIAAAPDMLALFNRALKDTEYVLCKEFWADVRAVVAKAEGSTFPSAQRHSED